MPVSDSEAGTARRGWSVPADMAASASFHVYA